MGTMKIQVKNGAYGSSTTTWSNFALQIERWVKAGAVVTVKAFENDRPTQVEANFPDGVTRYAQYIPSAAELQKF